MPGTRPVDEATSRLNALADDGGADAWRIEHERTTRCRDIEEGIKATFAALQRIHDAVMLAERSGWVGSPEEHSRLRESLARISTAFFKVHRFMTEWIEKIRRARYAADGLAESEATLARLADTLVRIAQRLDVGHFVSAPERVEPDWKADARGGSAGSRDEIAGVLERHRAQRRGTPIKVRSVPSRPFDPTSLSAEVPVASDLPRTGPTEPVSVRDVGSRDLPPPITWRVLG